jgi:hypothetical protein
MNQPPQSNALGSALSKIEPFLRSTWVRSRPTLLATLKSLVGLGQEVTTALEAQIAAEASSPAPLNFAPKGRDHLLGKGSALVGEDYRGGAIAPRWRNQ